MRAKHSGPASRINSDPETAAIARNLRARPRQRDPKPKPPPLTGTAAAAERHQPGISRERAQKIATEWTANHMFSDTEAAAWWSTGGLGFGDALLASVLREHRIRPDHMPVVVRGETIRERIVGHSMAPERIVRILRDQNLL